MAERQINSAAAPDYRMASLTAQEFGAKCQSKREIYRFLSLYKQTIIHGVISSALYIIVFGQALGSRITDDKIAASYGSYM